MNPLSDTLTKEESAKTTPRFAELDSLRGLAALSVLLFHYTYNQSGINPFLEFRMGVTGVDIFFMISGFVILLSIRRVNRLQDFIVYRFSRLYPTYWICVLITAIAIFLNQPNALTINDIFVNLTMIQTFFGVEDLDGSYWTLLVELLFYLWIIFVYMAKKMDRVTDAGLATLIVILIYHYFRDFYPDAYAFIQAKLSITNHFPLFLSGIIFYELKYKGFSLKNAAYLLFAVLSTFYLHDKGGRAMHIISYIQHDLVIVFFHVVFLMMILGKLKFLVKPYFIFLGNISYSLYLLHQYIGRSIITVLTYEAHLNIYLSIFVAIICTISLAYLVTNYVEIPAIRYIRTRYKKYLGADHMPELKFN